MLFKVNVVIIIIAAILFITKPSQADIEQDIKASMIANINAASTNSGRGPVEDLLRMSCKFDAESCYKIARANTQVIFKDLYLFWMVGLNSANQKEICYFALKTKIYCSKWRS